jgi:hypothetical protein
VEPGAEAEINIFGSATLFFSIPPKSFVLTSNMQLCIRNSTRYSIEKIECFVNNFKVPIRIFTQTTAIRKMMCLDIYMLYVCHCSSAGDKVSEAASSWSQEVEDWKDDMGNAEPVDEVSVDYSTKSVEKRADKWSKNVSKNVSCMEGSEPEKNKEPIRKSTDDGKKELTKVSQQYADKCPTPAEWKR